MIVRIAFHMASLRAKVRAVFCSVKFCNRSLSSLRELIAEEYSGLALHLLSCDLRLWILR